MTSVNSHFSSHFPPVYYIVVDIQFARHATFSTPHTHFLLQLLCEFAPAVAVSVFVLTKASLLSLRICMFFLPLQYIKFPSARYSLHSYIHEKSKAPACKQAEPSFLHVCMSRYAFTSFPCRHPSEGLPECLP